jgi:radical SAM protein with 4Fe4S-binding SPASM domain
LPEILDRPQTWPVASEGADALPRSVSASNRTYVMRGRARDKALDLYHLILAPTHACNIRCKHCYLPDHAAHMMPLEGVTQLFQAWEGIVLAERGPRGGYFHLKGGEPLILPYFRPLLDMIGCSRSLRFMMTTNGTLPTPENLGAIDALNTRLDGDAIIIISLDGSCEEVHRLLRGPRHFAASETFARHLIAAGVNVHFNYVVHSGNLHDVTDFVHFAETIGAHQVNFLPFVPKGYGEELGETGRPDPEVLHRTLADLYVDGDARRRALLAGNYADILAAERAGTGTASECVAGYRGLFYVTPEGNVYSCPNLVDASLALGNCFAQGLLEIHGSLQRFHRERMVSVDLDDRYLCRGERFGSGRIIRLRAAADYGPATRRLQEILLREGTATVEADTGMAYCFSRNF